MAGFRLVCFEGGPGLVCGLVYGSEYVGVCAVCWLLGCADHVGGCDV